MVNKKLLFLYGSIILISGFDYSIYDCKQCIDMKGR